MLNRCFFVWTHCNVTPANTNNLNHDKADNIQPNIFIHIEPLAVNFNHDDLEWNQGHLDIIEQLISFYKTVYRH